MENTKTNSNFIGESENMEETSKTNSRLVDMLTDQNKQLQTDVTNSKSQIAILERENKELKTSNDKFSGIFEKYGLSEKTLKNIFESASAEEIELFAKKLSKDKSLSSILESSVNVNAELTELQNYRELGSVKQISDFVDKSKKIFESYKAIGTPAQIIETLGNYREKLESAFDILKKYQKLGSPETIERAINESIEIVKDVASEDENLAIMEELNKNVALVKEYEQYGSPEEFGKLIKLATKMKDSINEAAQRENVVKLSGKYNVPRETVKELLGKYDAKDVQALLESISEPDTKSLTSISESAKKPVGSKQKIERGENYGRFFSGFLRTGLANS